MRIKYPHIVLIIFWSTWFWCASALQLVPTLLPVIQQSLSLSTSASSIMVGISSLGQSISAFLSGFLCKRLGRKKTILLGVAFASFSILSASLLNYYLAMMFLLFLFGVGIGAYLPAAISVLSDLSSFKNRGKYVGFHETAVPAGATVGPIIVGLALLSGLGWNGILQIWPIPVAIIIPALIMFVKEPTSQQPSDHLHPNDSEKSGVLWPFSSFLLLLLALVFRGTVMSVTALLPLYWTKELGVEVYVAAFALGATGVLAIFGQVVAGHLSDVFGRLRVLVTLNLLMTVMLAMCLYLPFNALLIISLIVFSLSGNAFMPVVFAFVPEMTTPEKRSRMIGLTIATIGLSNSLHSGVLGFLVDGFGFATAWIYSIALCFLSCLFLLGLRKRRPKTNQSQLPDIKPSIPSNWATEKSDNAVS